MVPFKYISTESARASKAMSISKVPLYLPTDNSCTRSRTRCSTPYRTATQQPQSPRPRRTRLDLYLELRSFDCELPRPANLSPIKLHKNRERAHCLQACVYNGDGQPAQTDYYLCHIVCLHRQYMCTPESVVMCRRFAHCIETEFASTVLILIARPRQRPLSCTRCSDRYTSQDSTIALHMPPPSPLAQELPSLQPVRILLNIAPVLPSPACLNN